jgi:hypothetical protein
MVFIYCLGQRQIICQEHTLTFGRSGRRWLSYLITDHNAEYQRIPNDLRAQVEQSRS